MSTLADRLRASVERDAINGDAQERAVCERQMIEAADALDEFWAEIKRLRTRYESRYFDEPTR